MEILLAAVVAAAVSAAVVLAAQRSRKVPAPAGGLPAQRRWPRRAPAGSAARALRGRRGGAEADEELGARRAELARLEERLRAKEGSIDGRIAELDERERSLEDRARNVEHNKAQLKEGKQQQLRELERVSGLSAAQAKQILLRELEDELRHESARLIRQVRRRPSATPTGAPAASSPRCMQRVAGGHAVETTVSVVELKSDELKGRIIGREGRNIRTLETLTGIDFIIDDTRAPCCCRGSTACGGRSRG